MKVNRQLVDDADRKKIPTKTKDSGQMVNLQNCNAGKIVISFGNADQKQREQQNETVVPETAPAQTNTEITPATTRKIKIMKRKNSQADLQNPDHGLSFVGKTDLKVVRTELKKQLDRIGSLERYEPMTQPTPAKEIPVRQNFEQLLEQGKQSVFSVQQLQKQTRQSNHTKSL